MYFILWIRHCDSVFNYTKGTSCYNSDFSPNVPVVYYLQQPWAAFQKDRFKEIPINEAAR